MPYDSSVPNETNLVRTASGDLVKMQGNFAVLEPVATSGLHGLISGGVPLSGSVPYLIASGTDQDWHYKQLGLGSLSGVNLAGAASGDTIRYDGQSWLPFLLHTVEVVSGTDIQGAIDALPNGGIIDARATGDMTIGSTLTLSGHCLLLGPHTYTVSAATAFKLKDGSRVLGISRALTTLFHASGQATSGVGIIENDDQPGGNADLDLASFTIDGNRANQANPAHGVLFINCSRTDVNVAIQGTGFYAYHHRNPLESNWFCHNRVEDCAPGYPTMVRVVNASGATSRDTRLDYNHLDGSGSDAGGIAVSAGSGMVFLGGSCNYNNVRVGNDADTNTLGIEVFSADSGNAQMLDFNVVGNMVSGSASGMLTKAISTSGRNPSGVLVAHNAVRDCPGVSYEAVGGHIKLVHNRAYNSGRISVALSQVAGSGIVFDGLDVSWNTVDHGTSSQGGIHVNCGSHILRGADIIGNQVILPSGGGIRVDGNLVNSRISLNRVHDSSLAAVGAHAFVFISAAGGVASGCIIHSNEVVDWTTGTGFRDQVSVDNQYGPNYLRNVNTHYSLGGSITGYSVVDFDDGHLQVDAGTQQAQLTIKTTDGNASLNFQCGSGANTGGFVFKRTGDPNLWNFRQNESDLLELRYVPNDARPFRIEPGVSTSDLLRLASGAAGTDAVGINTGSPSERLHVVGSGLVVGDFQVTSGGGPITVLSGDGAITAPQLKAGASQGAAGAVSGEIWVDTASGNVLKLGT